MRIVPAVDIRGGLCVNLVQGDYAQETVFSEDPVAQAVSWYEQGATLIHIVDLDGAKAGQCCIQAQLEGIWREGVPFEVGGGIRNLETVRMLAELGAERIILGTAAYKDRSFLMQAIEAYPDRIAVGIDAREGKVALSGWLETTDTDAVQFARRMVDMGATRIVYTDILSDGMMLGPNIAATRAVAEAAGAPVTASGGMSSLEDVRAVSALGPCGVDEVIIGRALYVNVFTLGEALAVANGTAA